MFLLYCIIFLIKDLCWNNSQRPLYADVGDLIQNLSKSSDKFPRDLNLHEERDVLPSTLRY